MNSEQKKMLLDAFERNKKGMDDSSVFLQIYNKDISKEWLPCLQLGLAIMMNKPIYLLVPKGEVIPENMKRLAREIEYFEKDEIEAATDRLFKRIKMR